MARWHRAARRLKLPPGSRVLDLGCAFGFGTRMLCERYQAFGQDLSHDYVERARRSVPGAVFTHGPADRVPYPDGFFDAVLLLDVLEHVPDERTVIPEIARVLRPGGRLILSVPNQGFLARADSLNVYHRLFGSRFGPPTSDPSWPKSPIHRHYSREHLESLLYPEFVTEDAEYTGIGIAEIINIPLVTLFRPATPLHRLYEFVQYLYFGMYLLEDQIHTGNWGYHLMLSAHRV